MDTRNRPQVKAANLSEKAILRVLIADDHQAMREGLADLLNEQEDLVVVGQAKSGKEAIVLARETLPDVILMDVAMPDMDGIDATLALLQENPSFSVVGLSMHDDPTTRRCMLEAGAVDYLAKTTTTQEIIGAVRKAAQARETSPISPSTDSER